MPVRTRETNEVPATDVDPGIGPMGAVHANGAAYRPLSAQVKTLPVR